MRARTHTHQDVNNFSSEKENWLYRKKRVSWGSRSVWFVGRWKAAAGDDHWEKRVFFFFFVFISKGKIDRACSLKLLLHTEEGGRPILRFLPPEYTHNVTKRVRPEDSELPLFVCIAAITTLYIQLSCWPIRQKNKESILLWTFYLVFVSTQ